MSDPTWVNPLTGDTEYLPLILGMDPGAEKGYAIVDPDPRFLHQHRRQSIVAPSVLSVATELSDLPASTRPLWSMVELQYVERVTSGEISALAIVRLAFRAGFMLRDSNGKQLFAATPRDWKPMLFAGGGGTVRKDIYSERLKRQLTDRERKLFAPIDQKHVDDVLDAVGIAWALAKALTRPELLRKWHVTGERMLPVNERKRTRETQFRQSLKGETSE